MKIGITYNIKENASEDKSLPPDFFAEWDDEDTIEAVRAALAKRHNVVLIEADDDAYGKLKSSRPDIVFNIAEGLWGQSRESQIPAMLDMLRIPYTGSGPLTLAICMDKARAKEIMAYHNVPTAKFFVITNCELRIADLKSQIANLKLLSFPLIVKPLYEGSSKGIRNNSVVRDEVELRERVGWVIGEYRQPALIEEYLEGREFTVAMIGNGNYLKVFPIVEIIYSSLPAGVNSIYSYEAKWIWDRPDNPLEIFKCPADIDNKLKKDIETVCRDAFNILNIKDWCRIDIRLDGEGRPHILELNPLPGILPDPKNNSCFPKAARAAGMNYDELINTVLDTACKRYGIKV
ncbi:MAG: D-alanine--D-alanine ligase [Deltaproteobacteria bacterium]|nr:D-alanine--D-alanine ligase [Deltaproteobacteria bacterium]MBI3756018.1 D-alanine--D-alanine ligase [Deltaproteobacteria bacterium]